MMLQIRTLFISFLTLATIYTILNSFWSYDIIKKLAQFFLAVHLTDIFIKFIWNSLPSQLLPDIAEKAVLITGCDTGFGNKLARELDKKGFKVFAGCLFSEDLGASNLKKDCSNNLHVVQVDVTKDEQVSSALKYVKNNLNGKPLHALVNNAGIFSTSEAEFMKIEELQNVLEVNAVGVHRMTKAFLPLLRESKGRILITASLSSTDCIPLMSAYTMSKHAVLSYANCIRRELMRWSVSVHTIEPGIYNTEMKNKKVMLSKIDDAFNHAPEETRQAYGGEAYRKLCLSVIDFVDVWESQRLEDVTDCMIDAIAAKYPKSRYHPGLKGRLQFWGVTNLPQDIEDIIVHVAIKIFSKRLGIYKKTK